MTEEKAKYEQKSHAMLQTKIHPMTDDRKETLNVQSIPYDLWRRACYVMEMWKTTMGRWYNQGICQNY